MIYDQSAEPICTAQYRAGSIEIRAVLLEYPEGANKRYGIRLEQAEECVTCELASDLLQARRLFFDVVFGGVTACTLCDVVEDRMGTLF